MTDVSDLVRLLDLEELDRDLYRAGNPEQEFLWHLYGGQVAAQALRAADLTVPDGRFVHSLHGYFLRPGRADRPILLHVDRDRDGRSFSARHVVARQNGDAILSLLVSFHVDEDGSDYQGPPMPEGLPTPDDLPEEPRVGHNTMFDLRHVGHGERLGGGPPGRHFRVPHQFWARTRGELPDDRRIHAAVLAYLSDMGSGFAKVPSGGPPQGGPSLDHALWFHRPARLDEWVLVDLEPVSSANSRGYYVGTIYDREGHLLASISQEALLRPRPPRPLRGDEPR